MSTENTFTAIDSLLLLRFSQIHGSDPGWFVNAAQFLNSLSYANGIKPFGCLSLDPASLKDIYDKLLKDGEKFDTSSIINHEQEFKANNSPKKRKLAGPKHLISNKRNESDRLLRNIISRLYTEYRTNVLKGVKDDEDQILDLQREIESIEGGSWDVGWQHLSVPAKSDADTSTDLPKARTEGSQVPATDSFPAPSKLGEGGNLASGRELPDTFSLKEKQNNKESDQIYRSERYNDAGSPSHDFLHDRFSDDKRQRKLHNQALNRSQESLLKSHYLLDNARLRDSLPHNYGSSKSPFSLPSQEYATKLQKVSLGDTTVDRAENTGYNNAITSLHEKHVDSDKIVPFNLSEDSENLQISDLQVKSTEKSEQLVDSLKDGAMRTKSHSHVQHFGDGLQSHKSTSSNHRYSAKSTQNAHLASSSPSVRKKPSEAVPASYKPSEHQAIHQVVDKNIPQSSRNSVISPPFTPSRSIGIAKAGTSQGSKGSPVASSVGSSNGVERSSRPSNEPSSVTKWRNVDLRSPASTQPLPRPRSFSPISDQEKAPANPETTEKRKSWKARMLPRRLLATQEAHNEELDIHQTRSGLRRGARLRTSSATSSAVARPPKADKRTPSVASHNDTTSIEDSFTVGKEVKAEPGTPQAAESPSSQQRLTPELPRTRSRRNAPQPLKLAPSLSGRRRRTLRQASVPDSTASSASTPNRAYVAASKSFQRTSAPLMNEIMTHKHASLFSAPVKEKNAEGYRDVIFQPQDLKSIRLAISAGARAVAAAAAAAAAAATTATATAATAPAGIADNTSIAGSPVAPVSSGVGSGTLLLPISPDLVPPRGIVNSTQLEQELMRMFANAVMFNPGDDGVVKDTREMFEAVTAAVDSWKQAERAVENRGRQPDDDEESFDTPEEEGKGRRKR